MPPKESFDFEETQHLTNWFAWVLSIGTLSLVLTILIYQIVTGIQVGDHPAPNGALIGFILIFCVPSIVLLKHAKLTIRINKHAIYYGWNLPTSELNKINWEDVHSWEIITYPFLGYGYRLTKKYGIVYNTKGKKGLQLTKKSSEKILLGSLLTEELHEILTKINPCQSK
ncbi:MAG: hypothetical protein V4565_03155 [Bacteroidota bacterium]